ncbi:hypothetical protein Sros_9118 [Streptosporangium roseum DSM 43021]|uniref:Uncharacterized protein n=1 Tax=Streptosporangium roseum (strain ATCC 12428 / DSM 43021 / JCM 3005 / KCTC 9067 / NCIMB 10171 / NRRL 2505 / NI 9100) TaxID=479432 RepID=D2BAX7_STRRD|nr:hypothetical protein Sros_9118 [Streptosporangium roseum DSM 43021]
MYLTPAVSASRICASTPSGLRSETISASTVGQTAMA